MDGFNGGDIIFQLVMIAFLFAIIFVIVTFIRRVGSGRQKQLDRIESMLKEKQEDKHK